MIETDSDLMNAQARVQVIQAILANSRRTLSPESFAMQSSGWLKEWDRLEKDIREYLATSAYTSELQSAGAG